MTELYLFIPIFVIVVIQLFRTFNFTQFQGIFLLGVIGVTLISFYMGLAPWPPILWGAVGEIVVNLLIGIKGKDIELKHYNYILTSIGLFPWLINPWASLAYAAFVLIGFGAGFWVRFGATRKTYAFDLSGIGVGVMAAAIVVALT